MSLGDVSLACASVVVDELVGAGVRHACVSPGSRSTPIALALERHPDITTHVHLDERSSAFFALGISKATHAPVVVATTSGTAAAELLPAVVEAFYSRVPLVLLTADRPPRLRGTGANQTIDQVELYGSYAVFAELPLPVEPVPVGTLRDLVADALHEASSPQISVHLNMPFDEPLTPEGDEVQLEKWEGRESWPMTSRAEVEGAEAFSRVVDGRRGVFVIGRIVEGPGKTILSVAGSLAWPVLAEPTSDLRLPGSALSADQALLASSPWMAGHAPEVVIQLGAAPTTRATQSVVASASQLVAIDADLPEPDPDGRATLRIREHPAVVASYMDTAYIAPAPKGWLESWETADAIARLTVDAMLDSTDEPSELRLARDLAAWIPAGGTLFVGNSMPVRDLDYAMAPREALRVLANRGASGIDGLVSTALGVATVNEGTTAALIGDLSFLHDAGALLWNGGARADLTLVVANNAGGRIFSFLPQSELPEFEKLFATPQGIEIEMVCEAAGVRYHRVEQMSQLKPALGSATDAGGINVIEVIVDPDRNRAQHREVQAAVDEVLRTEAAP